MTFADTTRQQPGLPRKIPCAEGADFCRAASPNDRFSLASGPKARWIARHPTVTSY
jgi:hypothetical protein